MTDATPDAPAAPAHPPGHVRHVPQGAYEAGYLVLATLFIALLMLTNVIGTKLFLLPLDIPVVGAYLRFVDGIVQALFPGQGGDDALTLTAGIITYPATFLFTDVVSEIYGRRRADLMVIMGFCASLFMLLVLWVAKALPPSPIWNVLDDFSSVFRADLLAPGADGDIVASSQAAQAAYSFTFDAPGTLLLASMTAYLCAQLVDNRMFHFWRRFTKGRFLWLRNNASTAVSQLVDTIIVNFIFLYFYWGLSMPEIGAIILAVYSVKLLIAFSDTPLCYVGVWVARAFVKGDERGVVERGPPVVL